MGLFSLSQRLEIAAVLIAEIIIASVHTTAANPVTLPLNGERTFECQETTNALWWEANGGGVLHLNDPDLMEDEEELLGNGTLRVKLTVRATEKNNNTIFECKAVMNAVVTVRTIQVNVQGLLQAPGGLRAQSPDTSTVLLQWTPPFTLDITDVDPDITHYSLYITENDIDTPEVTQVNVTGTQYVFTGDRCKDATYEFGITAWNVVGEGEVGTFPGLYNLKASETLSVEVLEIAVSLPDEVAEVACDFRISTTCPGIPLPTSCDLEVSPSTGETESFRFRLDGGSNFRVNINEEMVLPMNDACDLKILCGAAHVEDHFTTFDTQSATVVLTPEPGRVTVECTFAQNSSAKGCLVTFSESSESPDCELELYRTKSELQATGQITLPRGTYHSQAYDIEQDGTNLLKQPAVTMEAFTIEDSTTLVCNLEDGLPNAESESGTDNDTLGLIIPVAVIVVFGVIAAVTVVIVLIVTIKRMRIRKRSRPDVEIPEVKQNPYETRPTSTRRTTSSDLESSGSSGNTVESQLSTDSTVQLEPPEGTPELMYASLRVARPTGQVLQRDVEVPYISIGHPHAP